MKLKSLNNNGLSKYGFIPEMEYDNPKFNGHQIGVAVGIIDNDSSNIVKNYLNKSLGDDETRNNLLLEFINDSSIIKIENAINQFNDNNELVRRTIYYMPYYVVDHSLYKPTVNFDNVTHASNVTYKLTVELLFVYDNLNRYVTVDFLTRNVPMLELVNDLFEEDSINENIPQIILGSVDDEKGFVLDFYDEAGERFDICMGHMSDYRDTLASVRLIDISHTIDNINE